uniref:Uncharacterized protein n=1 Tax=Oryza brachyantha TaxID=4533 RepID=J3MBN7_ORYBR
MVGKKRVEAPFKKPRSRPRRRLLLRPPPPSSSSSVQVTPRRSPAVGGNNNYVYHFGSTPRLNRNCSAIAQERAYKSAVEFGANPPTKLPARERRIDPVSYGEYGAREAAYSYQRLAASWLGAADVGFLEPSRSPQPPPPGVRLLPPRHWTPAPPS